MADGITACPAEDAVHVYAAEYDSNGPGDGPTWTVKAVRLPEHARLAELPPRPEDTPADVRSALAAWALAGVPDPRLEQLQQAVRDLADRLGCSASTLSGPYVGNVLRPLLGDQSREGKA